ncbi:hypothetical protein CsSME_00045888 [Camellia sinensis var. sinensis]
MEEVIWKEKGEDDATNKMKFPALESMTLFGLPMLIGFCRGTGEIEFPQLKKLSLGRLPQLNSSNPFSESLENHNATFLSLFPHKVCPHVFLFLRSSLSFFRSFLIFSIRKSNHSILIMRTRF